MSRISRPAFIAALLTATLLLADGRAWALCAMCQADLAAQGPHAASVVNLAILVLLFPAVALFGGVCLVALRSVNPAQSDVEHQDVQ